jgi:DNA repair protein RecO
LSRGAASLLKPVASGELDSCLAMGTGLTRYGVIFMAYETYTTDALVCGTKHRNTADGAFLLFTREAGMLWAEARSVREERSRQRYALQTFSRIRVTLIKGKHSWKIGSAEAQKNYYHLAHDKSARGSVVSIFRLLRRFVSGEQADQHFFDQTSTMIEELSSDLPERQFVSLVLQVRLLAHLGYVDQESIPHALQSGTVAEVATQVTPETKHKIETLYVNAVAVSHL